MDERRTFLLDLQDQARNRQMRVEEEMAEVQDAEEELAGLKYVRSFRFCLSRHLLLQFGTDQLIVFIRHT